MGTLASLAVIGVLGALAWVWGYYSRCKILQSSAFWSENGSQCRP